MPQVLRTTDGKNHIILDERDILTLTEEYCGPDVRRWLEAWVQTQSQSRDEANEAASLLEAENDSLRDHHRLVLSGIYEEAAWLLKLTGDPKPKRSDLRSCAESICNALYREL